jgi:hypothetical protein
MAGRWASTHIVSVGAKQGAVLCIALHGDPTVPSSSDPGLKKSGYLYSWEGLLTQLELGGPSCSYANKQVYKYIYNIIYIYI